MHCQPPFRAAAIALAVLALIVQSRAQPDVIVGDLTGPSNYSADGTHDAFAIGTTSCNIGNANLTWNANTNQHPVISQSLYKFDNGRFTMIGQSWLKHGFGALQGSLCQPCTGTGNWQALGVGCSDPYGSSLNGSQSDLGPKSEVNASTGFFPFPPSDPSWSGSTARRLRVPLALLDPAAQYVVEGQYIQPEDAMAGNGNNNASWRHATISGGPSNYGMSLSGSTMREQPAIEAWQVFDPDVILQTIQVPGIDGGQLNLGIRRTDNGDGTWHFEVALHNLNCHDSVGSLTVSFAPGVIVSNPGFHAPEWHSNEVYDNNPWAPLTAADGVTFMVDQPFSTNPDANALRWQTTYSFWFDATDPAPTGSVVGLFRSGGTASFPAPSFPVPVWEANDVDARLDIDGLTHDPSVGPIQAFMQVGTPHTLNMDGLPGGFFDLFTTAVPGVPSGFVTAGEQVVNLDLLHPSFASVYGGLIPLPPGGVSAPFSPPAPFSITAQMFMANPSHPDGFSLSACLEATAFSGLQVVVEAHGPNSWNSVTSSGFWRVTHTGAGAPITGVTFDFTGATGPAQGVHFDTNEVQMNGAFHQGGTYRNNSAALAGLDYTGSTFSGCGWIGTNQATSSQYSLSTIEFQFSGGLFTGMTFEFDADTDPGTQTGADHAGLPVTVTLAGGSTLSGVLAQDPTNPDRVFVEL